MSDLVERLRWWGAKQKPPRGMDTLPADCREAASRLSQQDAELERMRREVEEAREARPVAWRWRSEIFTEWTVTDVPPPSTQAEMERLTGLNMTGLEIEPLYVKSEETRT